MLYSTGKAIELLLNGYSMRHSSMSKSHYYYYDKYARVFKDQNHKILHDSEIQVNGDWQIVNTKLAILPLTIQEFREKYGVNFMVLTEYTEYLTTNEDIHHYNGMTKTEWLALQVTIAETEEILQ